MKTSIRVLTFAACCSAIGCTWSEPHRLVYGDCMDRWRAYEQDSVGYRGEVFPEGIDKHDYCWDVARQRARELKGRGILVNNVY